MNDDTLKALWQSRTSTVSSLVEPERILSAVRGELPPAEVRELLAQLASDPQLAEEWRLAMALEATELQTVSEPGVLSRLAEGASEAAQAALDWVFGGDASFGLSLQVAGVLAAPKVRPGDRFQVKIDEPDDAEERRVVVLRKQERNWTVVFPSSPDEDLSLSELDSEGDGTRTLDLLATDPPGRQEWAVVLPRADRPVDFDDSVNSRWADLRSQVATGSVPWAAVEVEVEVID